ncbi:gibberellin-regulated protein 11-like isoform X2 [Lotus japonicus]|uniref:gibberellin-regulated protein 11-like isoform X2 n=1 Tax=Lotus japonicus TaxID=34305 RepID=UPI002589966E|nr:gibberellin-regulated protein 11-like isoform X2 [Lotus japonicus]
MAFSKLLIASLLVSFILLHLVHADQAVPAQADQVSLLQDIDCDGACAARCSKASRQRLCHRACGTCCRRCHCVPPGTSGHQEVCPCYASLTTHGGRKKCP